MRYWFWWETSTFDTYRGDGFDVMQAARNIYAPLVSIGMGGAVQGLASDGWTVSRDGRTWRFHIRRGLTFEDGSPITPAVALANFKRILWLTRSEQLPLNALLPELAGWGKYSDPLRSVAAEGEYMVFRFSRRPDNLFDLLSHPVYGLASPRCWDADGKWKEPFCSNASGQYRVAERKPGMIRLVSRGIYEAVPGAPAEVEIRFPSPGESSLKAMFEGRGDLAIEPMFALGEESLRGIAGKGFRITEELPSRMYFVQLNHRRAPFSEAGLRLSVRDMFLSGLGRSPYFSGGRKPDPSFMPRGGVGYRRFEIPTAGGPRVRGSGRLEVIFFPLATYSGKQDAAMQDEAEAELLRALRRHGFEPHVSRYQDKREAIARLRKGDFDVIIRGSGVSESDPYSWLKMMFMSGISAMIPDPSGRASAAIEKALRSEDPLARKGAIEEMNGAIFSDAAVINFAHSSWVYVHRPEVDMSRFNLFMDPIEFRAVGWRP